MNASENTGPSGNGSGGSEPVTVIEVQKVFTHNGERLKIATPERDRSIRLDALELESVSWQDHGRFSELLAESDYEQSVVPAIDVRDSDCSPVVVTNEYGHAEVQRIPHTKADKLEIVAPKLQYSVRLDPPELYAICIQDRSTFSDFLATPFGPESDHGH